MLQKIADLPYPRVFWQSPFSTRYRIAWGHKERVRLLPPICNSTWFGCSGFDKDQGWFFEPEEIREEEGSLFSLHNPGKLPAIIERRDEPSYALWKKNVGIALEQTDQGVVDKVVLARRTSLYLASPLSPWDLLAYMERKRDTTTTLFLVQRSPLTSFIGATPEKLYERKGNELRTMALAGTMRRSRTKEEDLLVKMQLLNLRKF
jgi:isochorismate synthase EntC